MTKESAAASRDSASYLDHPHDGIREALDIAVTGGDGWPQVIIPDFSRLTGKARDNAFDEW
ncbi:MAG: hypothetical protein LUG50_04090 [Planctomycetaceae bacterium]|nr:hypothetical protein [Planctomycetaceae bacterium]